jgi:hypothetical protein
MPEWLTTLDLSDLKLVVFFVLVGTVLFLSRDRGEERVARRIPAVLKQAQRKSLFFGRLGLRL